MAARPLSEAVQQAEEAMSGGNYHLAAETCRRVLGQFPEFATAHRLLGEACLEDGDAESAEEAFRDTLQRDPQSSASYAGLATIAEGKGDINSALAYAQVAWEIAPQRSDLRDRVANLSERLYGKGGRLHLTRAALTSLHFHAGRWSRAAAEASAVLAEHPTRVDVQLRMAEALWRRGSLPAAANACRSVLSSAPSAVMALLILADIERRDANQGSADQLLEHARAIDPDGVRAADLVTIGASDLAEFILPSHVPEFDDTAEVTAEVERPRIAPAPDFSWTEPEQHEEIFETDEVVSESPSLMDSAQTAAETDISEEDFGVSLPDDAEIDAARPPAQAQRGYTSMLNSLEGEGLTPFNVEGEEVQEPSYEYELPMSVDVEAEAQTKAEAQSDDVFGLVSDEEIDAARPPEERPHGYTTLLNSLGESGLAPFEVEGEQVRSAEVEQEEVIFEPAAQLETSAPSEEPFDIEGELTAGWDEIDEEIERATPVDEASLKGYTGELRDLAEFGVQPFSVEGTDEPISAEDEFAEDIELDASFGENLASMDAASVSESTPVEEVNSVPSELDLTDGWAAIDEEIQNAIPADIPRGYTDELNAITQTGVEPFAVESDEIEFPIEVESEEPDPYTSRQDSTDELEAGIDLWTLENESEEEITAGSAVESPETQQETVSEADLFDFGDSESTIVEPVTQIQAADTPDTSEWEMSPEANEIVTDDEPLAAELVKPLSDYEVEETAATPVSDVETGDMVSTSILRLGVDARLFARAREIKAKLIEAGQLQGDTLLPGVEPPGPTLETLEEMVQQDPEDQDLRRQFAAALLDAEAFERAFVQYQWMFREQRSFNEDDLRNLARVTESGGAQEITGHRLLGAVYRRRGDFGLSARHYHLSLAKYLNAGGKEA